MAQFIEVTTRSGKVLINTSRIDSVAPNITSREKTRIWLISDPEECYDVMESYEEVKRKIEELSK